MFENNLSSDGMDYLKSGQRLGFVAQGESQIQTLERQRRLEELWSAEDMLESSVDCKTRDPASEAWGIVVLWVDLNCKTRDPASEAWGTAVLWVDLNCRRLKVYRMERTI